jgi:hypothetical protein
MTKKKKLSYSRGDAVLQKNRPVGKGLSKGAMDKLGRKYERYTKQGVPRDLWDNELIMYEAYEVHGLSCPSSPVVQGLQQTEKRQQKDIPEGKD